jgi:[phosphatase 2A protein]-leucine-carboxy methyltransferase
MSAHQIPNLNSLRRGGLRGRGRGSGTQEGWRPGENRSIRQNKDESIQNTDNDAATSRLSAVEAGYLDDPFARLLSMDDDFPRRLPLMNRGWFITEDS